LAPFNIARSGRERSVHFNNQYDASTRRQSKVERMIDGQSLKLTNDQFKEGLKDEDNPQGSKYWGVRNQPDNTGNHLGSETILY